MTDDSILHPPAKRLRAAAIAAYVREAGYRGVVAFSCGHATAELKRTGLYVVDISPVGDLAPTRWWTPAEVHRAFPDLFDATPGHLPAPLVADIAERLKAHIGYLPAGTTYDVPTGSGETITALSLAYPACHFRPRYGADPATRREERAPMNPYADRLAADAGLAAYAGL